ncbi:Boi1p KNAG_0B02230 [Huiozyma naganishii CBS 8797]|uniref:Protein BOI2 n=1 Tax=Huiozyma naganishii (strain ATCC MYA-139 / BCRC 22969 / CBS 8797 / KCTC 17520 / NBRC 10181 / NCYC 3082 / Yp74L-3) TaxID=1071383 RepID=J7R1H2_HUIN7|nr:hypothetical protein KNAG_0B02230 [Kazachstania naganishii CBS 8797]CCK68665.1 hypothetical protein KNAG_0B02230 [Kazachstania naganishii CBS 8797]
MQDDTRRMSRLGGQMAKTYPRRVVINRYAKRMEDELDLVPGDRIEVLEADELYGDGWYTGKNLSRGSQVGLFPEVFTKVVDAEEPFPGTKLDNARNSSLNAISDTMNDIDKALNDLQNDNRPLQDQTASGAVSGEESPASLSFWMTIPALTRGQVLHFRGGRLADNTSVDTLTNFDLSNVTNWTSSEVAGYFCARGVDRANAAQFDKHNITGAILMELELSHLKEIQIEPFGTRFEVFKEITRIKNEPKVPIISAGSIPSLSSGVNHLMPAPSVSPWSMSSNEQRQGPSQVLISNGSYSSGTRVDERHLRTASEKLAGLAISSNEHIFDEPGIAPKPPSYPSPVQPPLSPVSRGNGSSHSSSPIFPQQQFQKSINNSNVLHESFSDSRDTRQPSSQSSGDYDGQHQSFTLKDFKVRNMNRKLAGHERHDSRTGTTPPLDAVTQMGYASRATITPSESTSLKRNSVVYTHRKSVSGGSFVDLFDRISSLSPSRNSMIDNTTGHRDISHSHSRSLSGTKTLPQSRRPSTANANMASHSRNASWQNNTNSIDAWKRKHRRNSSMLSFLSPSEKMVFSPTQILRKNNTGGSNDNSPKPSHSRNGSVSSPLKSEYTELPMTLRSPTQQKHKTPRKKNRHSTLIDPSAVASKAPPQQTASHHRRSSTSNSQSKPMTRPKLENAETQNATSSSSSKSKIKFPGSKKQQTSAFQEGIRTISVDDAIENADCSGWMRKKGSGTVGTWKKRFFTLHGTRLSYFVSLSDVKERGLIDITSHRVVPVDDDDNILSLAATSMGKGKYCFKLVPPQPGSKKGLTFTQPRVHYFAVDSKDEMKVWLSALIKASIDVDSDVPVISSYAMPTISLSNAQQMLKDAKTELVLRDHQRLKEKDDGRLMWEQQQKENDKRKSAF